jgi:hypothetical protein
VRAAPGLVRPGGQDHHGVMTGSRALGIATLVAWAGTAAIGGVMLRALIARGSLRRQRARRDGLPPTALFLHFGLALSGLAAWIGYQTSGWAPLAWAGIVLLTPAIGLGISTLTLWTPFPDSAPPPATRPQPGAGGHGEDGASFPGGMLTAPAEDALASKITDEVLARAAHNEALMSQLVEDLLARSRPGHPRPARKPAGHHLSAFLPVLHGFGALATFILAVITAALAT